MFFTVMARIKPLMDGLRPLYEARLKGIAVESACASSLPPATERMLRLAIRLVLSNYEDAVAQCEPLVGVGGNRGIKRSMSDCNTR